MSRREDSRDETRVNHIFKKRREEGMYQILMVNHLLAEQVKFREFLRVNRCQLNYLLDMVIGPLTRSATERHPIPISPEEKLYITLH